MVKQKGKLYDDMAYFVDTYPKRLSGSKSLEDSIDYFTTLLKDSKMNITHDQVIVPKWERGEEFAEIRYPEKRKLEITALGTSVGTPADGVEALLLVVTSFDDLDKKSSSC